MLATYAVGEGKWICESQTQKERVAKGKWGHGSAQLLPGFRPRDSSILKAVLNVQHGDAEAIGYSLATAHHLEVPVDVSSNADRARPKSQLVEHVALMSTHLPDLRQLQSTLPLPLRRPQTLPRSRAQCVTTKKWTS